MAATPQGTLATWSDNRFYYINITRGSRRETGSFRPHHRNAASFDLAGGPGTREVYFCHCTANIIIPYLAKSGRRVFFPGLRSVLERQQRLAPLGTQAALRELTSLWRSPLDRDRARRNGVQIENQSAEPMRSAAAPCLLSSTVERRLTS